MQLFVFNLLEFENKFHEICAQISSRCKIRRDDHKKDVNTCYNIAEISFNA